MDATETKKTKGGDVMKQLTFEFADEVVLKMKEHTHKTASVRCGECHYSSLFFFSIGDEEYHEYKDEVHGQVHTFTNWLCSLCMCERLSNEPYIIYRVRESAPDSKAKGGIDGSSEETKKGESCGVVHAG